jgi:hypothetical protein
VDGNIQTLLEGVMNWQPSGFFSPSASGEAPSSPLMLSPGLLDLLSSANKS